MSCQADPVWPQAALASNTEMSSPAFTEDNRAQIERTIPLRRIATAEDVAGPILFLCSPLSRHITGEVLNVNGGSVLCG